MRYSLGLLALVSALVLLDSSAARAGHVHSLSKHLARWTGCGWSEGYHARGACRHGRSHADSYGHLQHGQPHGYKSVTMSPYPLAPGQPPSMQRLPAIGAELLPPPRSR